MRKIRSAAAMAVAAVALVTPAFSAVPTYAHEPRHCQTKNGYTLCVDVATTPQDDETGLIVRKIIMTPSGRCGSHPAYDGGLVVTSDPRFQQTIDFLNLPPLQQCGGFPTKFEGLSVIGPDQGPMGVSVRYVVHHGEGGHGSTFLFQFKTCDGDQDNGHNGISLC